ncbi:Frizzled-5, partial [Fasciolopsis buskii]
INPSEDLRFLPCSIFAPTCIESYASFLTLCRSICERVKAGCTPIMQHYNFPWPDRMSCDQFPEYNNPDGVLCMERNLTKHLQLVFLFVGVIFLLAGFVALFRIRGALKLQRIGMNKTDRLETLMLRIGIFGALYTIPNVIALVCMGYELRNSHIWQLGQMRRCAYETTKAAVREHALNPLPEWILLRPDYIMFPVKHFMSLIIGVTSRFWIWSYKTLNSWRLLCRGRYCSAGVGRSSHSGTMQLLTTTTNAADPNFSSKQNPVPWSVLPSAASTR